MNISMKTKLKERLLEIPLRSKAYREKYSLASELNIEVKYIELLLKELCELKILEETIEYICKRCNDTTILSNKLLEELIVEDQSFECDNCTDLVDSLRDKTGYVYYDVLDLESLKKW